MDSTNNNRQLISQSRVAITQYVGIAQFIIDHHRYINVTFKNYALDYLPASIYIWAILAEVPDQQVAKQVSHLSSDWPQ